MRIGFTKLRWMLALMGLGLAVPVQSKATDIIGALCSSFLEPYRDAKEILRISEYVSSSFPYGAWTPFLKQTEQLVRWHKLLIAVQARFGKRETTDFLENLRAQGDPEMGLEPLDLETTDLESIRGALMQAKAQASQRGARSAVTLKPFFDFQERVAVRLFSEAVGVIDKKLKDARPKATKTRRAKEAVPETPPPAPKPDPAPEPQKAEPEKPEPTADPAHLFEETLLEAAGREALRFPRGPWTPLVDEATQMIRWEKLLLNLRDRFGAIDSSAFLENLRKHGDSKLGLVPLGIYPDLRTIREHLTQDKARAMALAGRQGISLKPVFQFHEIIADGLYSKKSGILDEQLKNAPLKTVKAPRIKPPVAAPEASAPRPKVEPTREQSPAPDPEPKLGTPTFDFDRENWPEEWFRKMRSKVDTLLQENRIQGAQMAIFVSDFQQLGKLLPWEGIGQTLARSTKVGAAEFALSLLSRDATELGQQLLLAGDVEAVKEVSKKIDALFDSIVSKLSSVAEAAFVAKRIQSLLIQGTALTTRLRTESVQGITWESLPEQNFVIFSIRQDLAQPDSARARYWIECLEIPLPSGSPARAYQKWVDSNRDEIEVEIDEWREYRAISEVSPQAESKAEPDIEPDAERLAANKIGSQLGTLDYLEVEAILAKMGFVFQRKGQWRLLVRRSDRKFYRHTESDVYRPAHIKSMLKRFGISLVEFAEAAGLN